MQHSFLPHGSVFVTQCKCSIRSIVMTMPANFYDLMLTLYLSGTVYNSIYYEVSVLPRLSTHTQLTCSGYLWSNYMTVLYREIFIIIVFSELFRCN